MVKKFIIMDTDDFESINSMIHDAIAEAKQFDDGSYIFNELIRRMKKYSVDAE